MLRCLPAGCRFNVRMMQRSDWETLVPTGPIKTNEAGGSSGKFEPVRGQNVDLHGEPTTQESQGRVMRFVDTAKDRVAEQLDFVATIDSSEHRRQNANVPLSTGDSHGVHVIYL